MNIFHILGIIISGKIGIMANKTNIVYSTNKNFKPEDDDNEDVRATGPKSQALKVWLEKNSRGGKTVSIVKGFVGSENELEKLAKLLKSKCGVGGTAKEGEILIQGDHRDKIVKILTDLGYPCKKAGG
jgi:translation initiation factor 1